MIQNRTNKRLSIHNISRNRHIIANVSQNVLLREIRNLLNVTGTWVVETIARGGEIMVGDPEPVLATRFVRPNYRVRVQW